MAANMSFLYHSPWGEPYQPDTYGTSMEQMYGINDGLQDYLQGDFLDEGFNNYYTFDPNQVASNSNVTEITGNAAKSEAAGDDLFALFDQYKPTFEHIAANAGVSDGELQNRLGQTASTYASQFDATRQEYERDMKRMGVNPNSAKFAGFGTSQALQKAAGLSAAMNQERQYAREEDWNENMEAAQLGLGISGQGLGAYGQASSLYKTAGDTLQNEKFRYDSLNEQARQFNINSNQNKVGQIAGVQNQAFNQGAKRWEDGMVNSFETAPGFGIIGSTISNAY